MIDPVRTPQLQSWQAVPVRPSVSDAEPIIQDGFTTGQGQQQPAPPNAVAPVQPPQQPEPSPYPRPMTSEEKANFGSWFPNLDVEASRVTAEATPQYNCISWTTGNTESWDWPPNMYPEQSPVGAFAQYYRDRGFSPVSADEAATIGKEKELVAYWEDPNGPTHGSVSGQTHGERWESKCGQAARIQHGRDELVSDVYGAIAGYWVKTGEGQPPVQDIPPEVTTRLDIKLASKLMRVDPQVAEQFESAYAEWQKDRQSPRLAMSSNPADYLKSAGYQKMVALGKDALPLFIQKMRDGDFFCQYAVQQLTRPEEGQFQIKGPNPQPELRAEQVRCSEQDKANQILVKWLDSQW